MEERICKYDKKPISPNRRSDALYCRDQCGWSYRNEKKAESNLEKRPHSRQLDENHRIIRELFSRDKCDVSIEALEVMGFDFEYCTGVEATDQQIGRTAFRLFEFIITVEKNRCKITKALL